MRYSDGANSDPNTFGTGEAGFRATAPYTVMSPATANSILGELANVLKGFGIALNGASYTQLFTALTVNNRQNVVQADAATGVFGSTSEPNDHPSSASNKWKLLWYGKTNSGTFVRFLVGDGDGDGTFAITVNAAWNAASGAQNWSSDNTGLPSTLLLGLPDTFQLSSRNAGAGTWTSWSNAAHLTLTGNLVVSGTASITQSVVGSSSIEGQTVVGVNGVNTPGSTGDFNHSPVKLVTSPIPLAGSTNLSRNGTDSGYGVASGIGAVPIRLPVGSVGGLLRIAYYQETTSPAVFKVISRQCDFSTPGASTHTQHGSTLTGPASSGFKRGAIDLTGLNVTDADTVYELTYDPGDTLDELNGLQMADWQSPGPRHSL
jgi:hypothetical protein